MLDVEFRIKNYRCFGDEPTVFRVRDGFTALVGTNNSGKSSLLRFLYEMRPLLNLFPSPGTISPLQNQIFSDHQWHWVPYMLSGERIVRAGSDRPMEVQIIVRDGPGGEFAYKGEQVVVSTGYSPTSATAVPAFSTRTIANMAKMPDAAAHMSATFFGPLLSAMDVLKNTMYIGPFRNAIHIGSNQNYYDIQTGDAFITTFGGSSSLTVLAWVGA